MSLAAFLQQGTTISLIDLHDDFDVSFPKEVEELQFLTDCLYDGIVAVLSGKPQLRHVEGVRSPGGTIQRPKLRVSDPQTPSRFSDSTSILANALKQRFKSVSSDSVESSPETSEKSKSVRIPAETRICENEKNKTQIKESNDSTPPSRPLLQEPAEP
jgi:hypothetical protein